MSRTLALEQYTEALKLGQKEYKDLTAKGLDPHPAVLDDILDKKALDYAVYVGTIDIPAERIVGTKSAGRISAFSKSFYPLLKPDTEFADKWITLCADHLGDTGIRDPLKCYEYMGNFYIQEGNKRFSILRSNGSPRVTGEVYRILPEKTEDTSVAAYYEFLDFYEESKLYDVMFRQTGNYSKLRNLLGFAPGQQWTEMERRKFRSHFHVFKEAYTAAGGEKLHMQPEDALLIWLQVNSFESLGSLSEAQIKKTLTEMWENLVAIDMPDKKVRTEAPATETKNILRILTQPSHVHVAFVHQRTAEISSWTAAHDDGRKHLEEVLGKAVEVRSYFNANTAEQADAILEQAITDGAQVVFTTTPQLMGPTLKFSLKYPKVRFFNCSVHMPYSSVHSYYCKIYEGKFITGAIAGAIAASHGCSRIGYVGSYPIMGTPASINAFALGARLTNPNAQVELKWSCLPGNPTQELLDSGIRVISNRDNPAGNQLYIEFGTFCQTEEGELIPLGSPCWLWGKFYENVIRSILAGTWDTEHTGHAINDWWGMRSGVIDVKLAENLPAGLKTLADILRRGLKDGSIDPFACPITAQDGSVKNDGSRIFEPEDLLHMDWLCDNVIGEIPSLEELLPMSRPTVQMLGINRDELPDIQEVIG